MGGGSAQIAFEVGKSVSIILCVTNQLRLFNSMYSNNFDAYMLNRTAVTNYRRDQSYRKHNKL